MGIVENEYTLLVAEKESANHFLCICLLEGTQKKGKWFKLGCIALLLLGLTINIQIAEGKKLCRISKLSAGCAIYCLKKPQP